MLNFKVEAVARHRRVLKRKVGIFNFELIYSIMLNRTKPVRSSVKSDDAAADADSDAVAGHDSDADDAISINQKSARLEMN